MKNEFIIVFQVNPPLSINTNGFASAVVKQFETEEGKTRYWVALHDQFLIDKFGKHHDYFYSELLGEKEKNYAQFSIGENPDIRHMHESIMKAIETYRQTYKQK